MADTPSDVRNREANAGVARRLGELYAVAAGLALASALERAVTVSDRGGWMASGDGALLFAFLVTLIPMYHGTMRHIDHEWTADKPAAPGLMLSDFVGLFLQAATLFVLGRQIPSVDGFTAWYAVLLGIDVLWAVVFVFGSYLGDRDSPSLAATELKKNLDPIGEGAGAWLWLNLTTLAVLGGLWLALDGVSVYALAGVALVRTVLDYWISWQFYFPHASTSLGVSLGRRPAKEAT